MRHVPRKDAVVRATRTSRFMNHKIDTNSHLIKKMMAENYKNGNYDRVKEDIDAYLRHAM